MFLAVAKRLPTDPVLIVLPIAFVFCNFTATLVEFFSTHEAKSLGPAVPEMIFLVLYSIFAQAAMRKPIET